MIAARRAVATVGRATENAAQTIVDNKEAILFTAAVVAVGAVNPPLGFALAMTGASNHNETVLPIIGYGMTQGCSPGRGTGKSSSRTGAPAATSGQRAAGVVDDAVEGATSVADDALVCRGGTCSADNFRNGRGVVTEADGTLSGVSVYSAPRKTLKELAVDNKIPNGQVGVTTVGKVKAAGGKITADPTAGRPDHAIMSGLVPEELERLFKPTQANPAKAK